MPEKMQRMAFQVSAASIARLANGDISSRDAAESIKKEFDQRFDLTWHCIVGTQFGSLVTYEVGRFIYFGINEHRILLWKRGKH